MTLAKETYFDGLRSRKNEFEGEAKFSTLFFQTRVRSSIISVLCSPSPRSSLYSLSQIPPPEVILFLRWRRASVVLAQYTSPHSPSGPTPRQTSMWRRSSTIPIQSSSSLIQYSFKTIPPWSICAGCNILIYSFQLITTLILSHRLKKKKGDQIQSTARWKWKPTSCEHRREEPSHLHLRIVVVLWILSLIAHACMRQFSTEN